MGRTTLISLTVLLGLSGCAFDGGDWSEYESIDKDVTEVGGADIESEFRDATKTYLSNRSLWALEQVGAIPGVLGDVARRVDGIIQHQPADGQLTIDELVQMEAPGYFPTLLDEEQDVFPQLWPLMEAPVGPAIAVDSVAFEAIAPVDLTVAPGELAVTPIPILSLPSPAMQTAARRLQRLPEFNSDSDAETVSLDDVQGAIDEPARFTPGDVTRFNEIRDEIRSRGLSEARALLELPAPGERELAVTALGSARIYQRETTSYSESRSITASARSGSWRVGFTGRRDLQPRIDLPAGAMAIAIPATENNERVFSAERDVFDLVADTYYIELWQDGVRIEHHVADVPTLSVQGESPELWRFADYDLQTPDGEPIVRNVMQAGFDGRTSRADFRFDLEELPEPVGVDRTALNQVATPLIRIEPGQYDLDVPSVGLVAFEVFPQGVLRVTQDGVTRRLGHNQLDRRHKFDTGFVGGPRVIFDPATSEIWIAARDGHAPNLRKVLQSSDRRN